MKKKLTSIVLLIFILFQCACANAEFQPWDSPREIPEDGKTMVPTGAVWRALDLYVGWSSENRIVGIYS